MTTTSLAIPNYLDELQQLGALTVNSLVLTDPDISYDRAESLCNYFGTIQDASKWWVADLLVYLGAVLPDEMPQLSESLNVSPDTRSRWMRVSERIPPSRRREELSWSHHMVVSSLEPGDQIMWLQRAIDEGLSKHQLEALIKPPKDPEDKHATCPSCGSTFLL